MGTVAALRARWTSADSLALSGQAPDLPAAGVTFADLDHGLRQAVALLQDHGVGPGEVVAMQCRRDRAFLELFLGTMALGAIALPLNPAYTRRERDWFLADADARLAVLLEPAAETSGISQLAAADLRALLDAQLPAALPADPDDDALAVLLYTSGTTGRPKGAMISHANLMATLTALHEAWGWSSRDHLLHALPLFHVHGLFVAMLGALWAGARTTWLARFDAAEVLRQLQPGGGTVFMGVPTYYHRLLAHPGPFGDLSGVRLFTSGSAPLPAATHAAFEARSGHTVLERYGMTEVGIVLSNPLNGERRPGAVGFPVGGVRARVAAPGSDETVDDGEIGEICIAGPSVISGYLGRPEATEAALGGGEMRTGDLGRIDPDGYFHIVGRMGDMIISGGLNVYPREVEAALLRHPAVAEAAVVGVPHPDWGEQVVGLVVCHSPATPASLIAHARTELAAYKCPKRLRRVETLPRNAMGKVQKHQIRDSWERSDPK